MKYLWQPENKPKILNVKVHSPRPQQIMLSVYHWKKPNTVYSRQITDIDGNDNFQISLPVTPEKAFFEIKPVSYTDMPFDSVDAGGMIVDVTEKDFVPGMNCNFNSNKTLQDFLRFTSWFSENAGVLSPGIYRSVGGKFEVKYSPVIMEEPFMRNGNGQLVENPRRGMESPTSFRVDANKVNGVTKMELSQKFVVPYTTTGRQVLFLHEGSHDFINVNPDDEAEADKHAVEIARCLGFGKREIANVFTDVFLRYPSDENKRRIELITQQLKTMN